MADEEWEELRRKFHGRRLKHYVRHFNDIKEIIDAWCQKSTEDKTLDAFNKKFLHETIERAREMTKDGQHEWTAYNWSEDEPPTKWT